MRFHQSATDELAVAAQWYEKKAVGVGGRFLDAVEDAVLTLTEHPNLGAAWQDPVFPQDLEVRRFPLRVFPFLIVYVLEPEPTIIAIAHGSRRPGYWTERMR